MREKAAENLEELVSTLKRWQEIEAASIEQHAEMEKETIDLAQKARKNCRLFARRHLLTYLVEDEEKHDRLLAQLEDFKRNIYPYA